MRVIVAGLGGVGSMAAWRLAAAGHDVVGLERFRVDHDRGSSYGDSRIVRSVYPMPLYTRLMRHAYEMWARLMADSGDDGLMVPCGGLFLGPRDHADVAAAAAALREIGVTHEPLEAAECMRRFPAFAMHSGEIALFEPGMGYARASRAVCAAIALAAGLGARIREECVLTQLETGGAAVAVRLASGDRLEADRLILAPGPWAAPLLATAGVHLPITVTRQPYVHLEPARDEHAFLPGLFPVWIDAAANVYGFPRLGDVPGVKIATHDFGRPCAPETVDRTLSEGDRETARSYAARRFPALSRKVVYEKVCLYSVTRDNDFIIDALPCDRRITLISACSGHGFKFTPLLGQIAADLAVEQNPKWDLAPFRLARFRGND